MTRRRWPRRPDAVGLAWSVLVLALALAVIAPSFGHLRPDTKPEIYLNPAASFRAYIWPWQDMPGMGGPSFNVGLAPVAGLVWLIEQAGTEPWLAARLLRLLLLLVAAWGAASLVRILPAVPPWRWAPFVAALLFVASPYTITAGATLPVLLPLATLPWLAHSLLRALDRGSLFRGPAAFGLVFAAGSGMNAGVIPVMQLLVVPAIVLLVVAAGSVSWRRAAPVVLACAGWTVLLSLYWIVPTVASRGAGGAVVENTETLAGIFGPSSLAESLRGLGLWPLYGGDSDGPWQPGLTAYLTSALVVVCSFLVPALILLVGSRAPRLVRHAFLPLVVAAVVLMAGGFPVRGPAPFGAALTWVFDTFPVLAAFRTTNKVGSLLALGMAVLGSSGLAAIRAGSAAARPGGGRARIARVTATACAAAVLAVAAFPLGTGGFYLARYDVPEYWREASRQLGSASPTQRVWLVPGERLANYRWASPSPDDVGRSLITPPSVVATTVPNGSPGAANLLAAADSALGDPDVAPEAVAAYARLLGAGAILARNDMAYEKAGALAPSLVAARLDGAPGVHLAGSFGAPGVNGGTLSTGGVPLPPLQLWAVEGPGAVLQSRPASGGVVLVGDAFAVPALLGAGVLVHDPVLWSAASMTPAALTAALRSGARIVLTDTNRRAALDSLRISANQGPLVGRTTSLESTLATGSAEDQTSLVVTGGSVSVAPGPGARAVRSVPFAEAAPENAFDGNPTTSWQLGGLADPVGGSVTRHFGHAVTLDEVVVRTADLGARRITRVRVQASGVSREAGVGLDGAARVALGGVRASSLSVSVSAVAGEGGSRVGIAEVETGEGTLTRVAALPDTVTRLARALGPTGRDLLDDAPVDVVLTRQNGGDAAADDEEFTLNRDFTIPGPRNYFVSAMVRPSPLVGDADFDTLAGFDDSVTVQGSSRAFDLPTLRGSQALDGRDDTAWIPGAPEQGQVLTITSKESRTFDHLTVRQEGVGGQALDNWVTGATVLVDGEVVGAGALAEGEATIRFPATKGRSLQLRLNTTARPTGTIRISEVDAGGLRMRKARDGAGCATVLTADGRPVSMRPASPVVDLSSRPWVTCGGEGLALEDGAHQVRGAGPWSVDSLSLRDGLGVEQPAPPQVGGLTRVEATPTRFAATTGTGDGPQAVILRQGWSSGWTATMDGRPLPAPGVVDGFGMGWLLEDSSSPHRIEIVYAPRTTAMIALGLSVLGVLAALAAATWRGRGPRVVPRATAPDPTQRGRRRGTANGLPRLLTSALLLAMVGGLSGGWWGLGIAAVLALALLSGASARLLVVLSAVVVALVPFWWLTGNSARLGTVSPDLVAGNLVPHYLVLGALLGLLASTRVAEPAGSEDR